MTAQTGWVKTGRIDSRKRCFSCNARVLYGDPKLNATWPSRLSLTDEQIKLLLVAAAEFMEIGGGTPVELIDWLTVDALGLARMHVDHDGAPPRTDTGNVAQHNDRSVHRHPFPLPLAGWRPSMREASE